MSITKEQLLEFGMIETTGDEKIIYPMKKVISIPPEKEDTDDDLGEIAICVDMEYNFLRLVLKLPDGSTLVICPETIDELKIFEKCIGGWESYY